jgi:hypothetical protein
MIRLLLNRKADATMVGGVSTSISSQSEQMLYGAIFTASRMAVLHGIAMEIIIDTHRIDRWHASDSMAMQSKRS